MKRVIIASGLALLLVGLGVVAWTVAGLPPLRQVWRYGFRYGPEPTGRTLTVEGVEFVEIGPGCFRMGSDLEDKRGDLLGRWCARLSLPWGNQPRPSTNGPVHWVGIPHGFWIARHEVTNEQFETFASDYERSEYSPGGCDPVVDVSWEDASDYCAWLGARSGVSLRLPSEAEWECACRAGSEHEFCFGNDETGLGEYAWYRANSTGKAHPVGTRRANAWGLHNLHGNVSEWCDDRYRALAPAEAMIDRQTWRDTSKANGEIQGRGIRGGSWDSPADECRSAEWCVDDVDFTCESIGFRPAFPRPCE
jgi:formylglycine-generating enzyme required for sulfatase activity